MKGILLRNYVQQKKAEEKEKFGNFKAEGTEKMFFSRKGSYQSAFKLKLI